MLFSLCIPAFASDEEINASDKNMSNTSIEYDFEHVFLKKYNVGQFYENKFKGQPELITMAETGYKQGDNKDYKLFFYVYNPTKLEIQKESELNLIQFSTNLYSENNTGYTYSKHSIKLVDTYANSINSETYTNALILKFEVSDCSIFSSQLSEEKERFYAVSSIELHLKDEVIASDFTIGNEYYYSTINGWTSYYSRELDVLRFEDLEFSYYRVPTEDPDVFKDIQSVVVPIPNSYLKKYDDISQVSAVWEECFMKPALIVNDADIANAFKEVLNQEDLEGFEYMFGAEFYELYGGTNYTEYGKFEYLFNNMFKSPNLYYVSLSEYLLAQYLVNPYGDDIGKLLYSFYSKNVYDSDAICVSSEELMEKLDEYGWSDDVFESIDKTHYDLDNPEVLKVTHLNSQDVYRVAKWYEFFKKMVKLEDEKKVFSDIQVIDDEHYSYKFGKSAFCEEYLVSAQDYNDIRQLHLKYPDCTLYVFHYTITDYVTHKAYVYDKSTTDYSESLCDAIIAQGTAIRNFDFIDITFDKGDSAVVIPVSMSPENYISDYTGNSSYQKPLDNWLNEFIKFFETVLAIVVVIMILTLALKIYSTFRVQKVKVKEPKNKRRKK